MEHLGVVVGGTPEIRNHRDDLGLMMQVGAPVYAGAADQ